MEGVLRGENLAEIIWIPIRHHSPACAWHVKQMIREIQPDCILIEGPENAKELIPVMVHPDTHAPFAVYYSYRDRDGKISKEKEDYKCYYPFLDYSPELVALREGSRLGIPVSFIDLPYGEILRASKEGKGLQNQEEKSNYNDDYLLARHEYINRLCEKTGVRSFDEFWEKYFELNGIREDSRTLFDHMNRYCELSREGTPEEVMEWDGCRKRESYMAWRILQELEKPGAAGEEGRRIMIVTGGFHTPGLKKLLGMEREELRKQAVLQGISKEDQSVYLMPYSMEAADALNGYASGMPFPGFYQRIWEALEEAGEKQALWEDDFRPFEEAILSAVVATGKEVRKKEGTLSTADEISACFMAQGLAGLRDKPEPGAYELWDCVLSSFIKGECTLSTDAPMRLLKEWMTGKQVGVLCGDASVPPIVHDFEKQCRDFGLKTYTTLDQEVTLSVFSSRKHRNMSIFFNRLKFLDTAYGRKKKGPDLQKGKDRNLIREIWTYKWSAQVTAALIDKSVYGGELQGACISMVKQKLRQDINAKEAVILLTQVFEMALEEEQQAVYDRVYEMILKDTSFYSIGQALPFLLMMEELSNLYRFTLSTDLLIGICCQKLIVLLPSMSQPKEEDLSECMKICKLLYQINGREEYLKEREAYQMALEQMAGNESIHPGLHGCIMGILYGSGRSLVDDVEGVCRGYLTGTREQLLKSASFFRGLFYTARDLVFIGSRFVKMLDCFLEEIGDEEFIGLLPELRMAFGYFTPREIHRIAGTAAGLHGMGRKQLFDLKEVLPECYTYGKQLDEYAGKLIGGEDDG